MIRFISLFFVLNLLFSCNMEENTLLNEENCSLDKSKLTTVLQDIFIYEAGLKTHSLKKQYKNVLVSDVYQEIYKKHKTTKKEIADAIECYTAKNEMISLLKELESTIKKQDNKFWENTNDSTSTIKK